MTPRFISRNLRVSLASACLATLAACGDHVHAAAPASSHSAVNIYAGTASGDLAPEAKRALPMIYVPNSRSGTVSVIDPRTYQVVRTFATGKVPQHVIPSYDLNTLWVANNSSGTLTPIDPTTGIRAHRCAWTTPTTSISRPTANTR